jgi:hypothetical protein
MSRYALFHKRSYTYGYAVTDDYPYPFTVEPGTYRYEVPTREWKVALLNARLINITVPNWESITEDQVPKEYRAMLLLIL